MILFRLAAGSNRQLSYPAALAHGGAPSELEMDGHGRLEGDFRDRPDTTAGEEAALCGVWSLYTLNGYDCQAFLSQTFSFCTVTKDASVRQSDNVCHCQF
jgi:hypothetical protein